MADAKITALTACTDPQGADVTVIVDDPAGTPITKKVTLANLIAMFLAAGGTMTVALEAADHGTAATDQVINVCYGTGDPPTASTTTEGTIFVKYTA
jgi:hypothetical protein